MRICLIRTPDEQLALEEMCCHLIRDLNEYGVCVLDNFLGHTSGIKVLDEVKTMYSAGLFKVCIVMTFVNMILIVPQLWMQIILICFLNPFLFCCCLIFGINRMGRLWRQKRNLINDTFVVIRLCGLTERNKALLT